MDQSENDRRIDYIELPAADIGRVKQFYADVFGWRFTDYGPDYTSFSDGRLGGGLRFDEEPPGKGVLVVIYAMDLEEVQRAVVAAGGAVIVEPFEFPGGRRFHFRDPGGNEIAVWSDH